jgi:hypothetical protein
MKLSGIWATQHWMTGLMNWKRLQVATPYSPAFAWRDWKIPHKTSVGIDGVLVEVQTTQLLNMTDNMLQP